MAPLSASAILMGDSLYVRGRGSFCWFLLVLEKSREGGFVKGISLHGNWKQEKRGEEQSRRDLRMDGSLVERMCDQYDVVFPKFSSLVSRRRRYASKTWIFRRA